MHLKNPLYLALVLFGLTACGGGGGGGDSAAVSTLTYRGNSDNASLTATSARGLGESVLDNVDGADSASQIRAADASRSLADIIRGVALAPKSAYTRDGHVLVGACGGDATTAGNEYGGSIVFNNYCEGNVSSFAERLNGTISYAATYTTDGLGNPVLESFTITFVNFTVTFLPDNEVFAFGGSLRVAFDATGWETGFTMSVVMQDETGAMVMFEDYVVSNSGGGVLISGRFCQSTHGCVTIATEQPLVYGSADYPTSGRLVLTGANGHKARLTATLSPTPGYLLELDTDGVPGYDGAGVFYTWPTN